MHHQNGKVAEKLQGVIPVGNPVQGVFHGSGKAQGLGGLVPVDGIGGARQSAGAQRTFVQPLKAVFQPGHIPFQHGPIGQKMLSKGDGLCSLQMGVAGHDGVFVLGSLLADGLFQSEKLGDDGGNVPTDKKAEVQRHLVIPGAAGVQAFAGLADLLGQPGFDVHVDVFLIQLEFHLALFDVQKDLPEALLDGFVVLLGDDALFGQHSGVGLAALDVFFVKALVKGDGGVEGVHQRIGVLAESSGPKFHIVSLSSFSVKRTGRRKFLRPGEFFKMDGPMAYSLPCSRSARTVSGRPHRLMKPVALVWS